MIGRTLVESDSDLATAYGLAKQIQLTPMTQWRPGPWHSIGMASLGFRWRTFL